MRRPFGILGGLLVAAVLASGGACMARSTQVEALTAADSCSRCHGFPPATDAHAIHVSADDGASGGVPHAAMQCLQCHKNVRTESEVDHIHRADGSFVPSPAEVRFDDGLSLASRTEAGASRSAGPSFDTSARTCSNVYCHGATLRGATSDVIAAPAWDAPHGTVSCGKCHGIPPTSHDPAITLANCTQCHGDAIDAAGVPNPDKHVNGTVDLAANVTSSCAACHGDHSAGVAAGDPRSAPPSDAEGRQDGPAVGAHQAHVVAGALGPAVACSECHVVPSTIFAPGHFDGQVTVKFGPLASAGGVTPTYNATSQTCSNVYCHGKFPSNLPSKAAQAPPAPAWGAGAPAVACGSCHDMPPPLPTHTTINVAMGCSTNSSSIPALACHPGPSATSPGYTFDPTTGTGTVDPKLHIDGKICPPACTP
jgi:predicted CxxxxCH...CXXCH cytochrome family protein